MEAQAERTQRDLARYQALLAQGRARLRDRFMDKELWAILDTLNGYWFADPSSAGSIAAEVEDAIALNGLAQKWELSGQALVQTLHGLTGLESMALADAVERWWARVGAGETTLEPVALWDEVS